MEALDEDVKSLRFQVKATDKRMCHEDESRGCEEPTLPGKSHCHENVHEDASRGCEELTPPGKS